MISRDVRFFFHLVPRQSCVCAEEDVRLLASPDMATPRATPDEFFQRVGFSSSRRLDDRIVWPQPFTGSQDMRATKGLAIAAKLIAGFTLVALLAASAHYIVSGPLPMFAAAASTLPGN